MMKMRLALAFACLALALGFPTNSGVASGDLDRSYGTNGYSNVPTSEASTTLAIQPDNKVLSGSQCRTDNFHFCFKRFLTTGALDTSFGDGGRVVTQGHEFWQCGRFSRDRRFRALT